MLTVCNKIFLLAAISMDILILVPVPDKRNRSICI